MALEKEQKIQRQYTRLADRYDSRWKGYIASTLQKAYEVLNPAGNERILDIACGTGVLEEIILKKHPYQRVVGFDLTKEMLQVACKKFAIRHNVHFLCANASKLPFATGSFDIVVCCNSFHYFIEPSTILDECFRVLNSDGRLILLDWCRNYLTCRLCDIFLKLFDHAHHNCYRFDELQSLIEGENFQIHSKMMFRANRFWGMMCFEAIKKKP
ncbi:MAG TPA: methyltransferase domain-containing protein [Candidatus Brocadiia bacterium]|nr:class I SAM-dependent methyltransferase [Candidatus Brocadiales bacterium]